MCVGNGNGCGFRPCTIVPACCSCVFPFFCVSAVAVVARFLELGDPSPQGLGPQRILGLDLSQTQSSPKSYLHRGNFFPQANTMHSNEGHDRVFFG